MDYPCNYGAAWPIAPCDTNLTHWPLRDLGLFGDNCLETHFTDRYFEHFIINCTVKFPWCECLQSHWWLNNTVIRQQETTWVMLTKFYDGIKRKPPCIGGMELVSLSCNRVFISAESVGRGWCKIAIATKWYQFHTTDKCGFLFMPWITDHYTFVQYTKLVNK